MSFLLSDVSEVTEYILNYTATDKIVSSSLILRGVYVLMNRLQ